jgi:hypothetical protein
VLASAPKLSVRTVLSDTLLTPLSLCPGRRAAGASFLWFGRRCGVGVNPNCKGFCFRF